MFNCEGHPKRRSMHTNAKQLRVDWLANSNSMDLMQKRHSFNVLVMELRFPRITRPLF